MRFLSHPKRVLTLAFFSLLLACSAPDSDSPQPVSPLNEPLPTETISVPAPAIPVATRASLTLITPTPSTDQAPNLLPTPTPFTYAVKSGDTISQIAQRYGLTVDEVVAANPGINTQILSIGQVIQIPSRPASLADARPAPANLAIGPLH
jgi:LysM repeat protein